MAGFKKHSKVFKRPARRVWPNPVRGACVGTPLNSKGKVDAYHRRNQTKKGKINEENALEHCVGPPQPQQRPLREPEQLPSTLLGAQLCLRKPADRFGIALATLSLM
ncbi:MAG: hypothetical protein DME65_12695 [Verrucomicrobia bacterium]|nr:MAG: hypothetical protein DME65_12695 [Verrucomicrobiota bacterium]